MLEWEAIVAIAINSISFRCVSAYMIFYSAAMDNSFKAKIEECCFDYTTKLDALVRSEFHGRSVALPYRVSNHNVDAIDCYSTTTRRAGSSALPPLLVYELRKCGNCKLSHGVNTFLQLLALL